jgi:hypothetical protein
MDAILENEISEDTIFLKLIRQRCAMYGVRYTR